jgi:hypothetical protein
MGEGVVPAGVPAAVVPPAVVVLVAAVVVLVAAVVELVAAVLPGEADVPGAGVVPPPSPEQVSLSGGHMSCSVTVLVAISQLLTGTLKMKASSFKSA